jgi:hypothetical protein
VSLTVLTARRPQQPGEPTRGVTAPQEAAGSVLS